MIWQLALEEEAESRMIVVHRSTMRVLPHKSAKHRVMNVNRDSRAYALRLFYDFQVDVSTLEVEFDLIEEMALYGQALDIYSDSTVMNAYRDVGGIILKQLRTHQNGEPKGTIYLSSQHDRFALASTKKDTDIPWNILRIDMVQRAFVPDAIVTDICTAENDGPDRESRDLLLINAAEFGTGFFSKYMGAKLPNDAVKRIRRVVHLHAGPQPTGGPHHTCGPTATLRPRHWKLGTFKGAQQLYTAQLASISSPTSLRIYHLLEWRKTEAAGPVSFACTCQEEAED